VPTNWQLCFPTGGSAEEPKKEEKERRKKEERGEYVVNSLSICSEPLDKAWKKKGGKKRKTLFNPARAAKVRKKKKGEEV